MITTAIIVLAAGPSSRLRKSKQMLDIHGEPLLIRTIKTALNIHSAQVAVVLGANEKEHRALLADLPVAIVQNDKWRSGMGSSLKAGLNYFLSGDPAPDAIIIMVCDQPLLETKNIENLISKYKEGRRPVIASRYSGSPGVPALFDKRYFQKLMMLSDDEGAKKVILQNRGDVSEVDFPGGEVDIDTLEDYDAFIKRNGDPPATS